MFDLRMETSDSVGYIITVGKPIVDAQLFTTAKEFHIILHKRVYTYIHYTYRADITHTINPLGVENRREEIVASR